MPVHRFWLLGVTVVVGAALTGPHAYGQSCYQGAGPSMVNICQTAQEDIDYRTYGTYAIAGVTVSPTSYVLDIHGNSLDVFDATNPANPTRLTPSAVNITWWPPPDGGADPSLVNRLRHVATLDGFPYVLGSFYTDGWDFFKLGTNRFLRVGYQPSGRTNYLNTALYWSGGEVYATGQLLDATAIAQRDPSVFVYKVQNAARTITPETLNYTSMVGTRVPIGGSGDDPAYSGFPLGTGGSLRYYPFTVNGHPWMLVFSGSQAVVVDLSHPPLNSPYPMGALWNSTTDPNLFSGTWAVDREHAVLHVVGRSSASVYSYDISNPAAGPAPIATTPWHDDSISPSCASPLISAGGGVIAVGCGSYVGYIPTDATGRPVPPFLLADSGPTEATYINPLQCNPALSLGPGIKSLSVFVTPSGQTSVARGLYSWGDVIVLSDTCLSTIPVPRLTVSRALNQGNLDAACTSGDARGYPGDTFTITNTSGGKSSNPILYYTPPGGSRQILANPMPTSYTWTPPTSGPTGQWGFDLDVTDDVGTHYVASAQTPPGNRTINLCSSPKALAQLTACSSGQCPALQNESVTISAAPTISQGHPTSYGWIVTPPSGIPQTQPTTAPTITVTLSTRGTYTVAMAAHYGFPGTDDTECSKAAYAGLLTSNYDSCASLTVNSQPFSVNPITVSQGTTPQPFLLSKAISVAAPYRLASNWTATFQWRLDGAPGTPAATWVGQPNVTGTIAASTLSAGSHTVDFVQAKATDGADSVDLVLLGTRPPPVAFNVVDCQPAVIPSNLSASVSGQAPSATVTFRWSGGGTSQVHYKAHDSALGLISCLSVDVTNCTTTVTSAGTFYFKVDASNACSGGTLTSTEEGSFTVTGGTPPPPTPTPTPPPSNRPTASFTFSPASPQVGQTIQFTDTSTNMSSGFAPVSWSWDFGDGLPPILASHTSTAQNPTFFYGNAQVYTVTLTATNAYGSSTPTTRQIVVTAPCTATAAPAASFTYVSPARATLPVQFTDTSAGGPTSWSWDFGDGMPPIIGAHTSTAQNPTNTFANPGTYTVKLTATNCKGSNLTQQQVVVAGACDLTAPPPTPDFTWGPTGPDPDYPQQQQPFAGQPVTLTVADATTGTPTSWTWSSDAGSITVHSPSFTFTWAQAGDVNVTLTATNCNGTSAAVTKTVHINDDIRPVVADFSWLPSNPATGAQVTFTAAEGLDYGNPDTFYWTFDDGSTQTGTSVTYSFKCGGTRSVTLTASRGTTNDSTSKSVPVQGKMCGPESVMAVDAAKIQGLNDTNWHADVRIFNPSAFPTSITLQFLPAGGNNFEPFKVGPYQPPLPPKGTLVLNDILQWVLDNFKQDFSKTALRITYKNDDDVAPVITVRTYNLRPDGSKYGQMSPGVNVLPGTTRSPLWITGMRNNGFDEGFRTNYSLLNLLGDAGGASGIKFTLFDATGNAVATKTVGLGPYGYIQDAIAGNNLFGPSVQTIGPFSLKIEVPTGDDIQVYASVMDNHTGDPVLIPADSPPDSPIYLAAIAHNSGEANTVWRTDLQVTNADSASAHTWEIEYAPRGQDNLPSVSRTITLAPETSLAVDDLVAWAYNGLLPSDAETSGIVRIAPADGTSVYPVVAARSYNLTASGTFGQGIPPLSAARGVSTTSNNRRLVLTGMSSEDIARTNLGFVNLSETQGVNFVVYFYDAAGNILNPTGDDGKPKAYTLAIAPGSWDQDKLENRFRNAFKVPLPSNLPAISAEITVSDGGPGYVYASVIDTLTGDPNFIPAQLSP